MIKVKVGGSKLRVQNSLTKILKIENWLNSKKYWKSCYLYQAHYLSIFLDFGQLSILQLNVNEILPCNSLPPTFLFITRGLGALNPTTNPTKLKKNWKPTTTCCVMSWNWDFKFLLRRLYLNLIWTGPAKIPFKRHWKSSLMFFFFSSLGRSLGKNLRLSGCSRTAVFLVKNF